MIKRPYRLAVQVGVTALALGAIPQVGAAAETPPICGQTLTQSVTLRDNVHCAGDGPTIGADGVTLNLNGHKLLGNYVPDGTTVGVRVEGHSGVTITGGEISHFGAGVYVHHGDHNTLSHLTVTENKGPLGADWGDGVVILNSSYNSVLQNTISHNGVYEGIGVFGPDSHGNRIANNVIDQNNVGGGEMGVSLGLAVFPGESVLEGGDHTVVSHNTISNSGLANVYMCGMVIDCVTFNNTISDNTIEDTLPSEHPFHPGSQWGVSIDTFYPAQVPKPFPSGQYEAHHVLKNNLVIYNGGYGINAWNAHSVRLIGNTAYGNGLESGLPPDQTYDLGGDCDPAVHQVWLDNYYVGAPGFTLTDVRFDFIPPPPGGCTSFIENNHHLDGPLTPPPVPVSPPAAAAQLSSSSASGTASVSAPAMEPSPLGSDTAAVLRSVTRGSSSPSAP